MWYLSKWCLIFLPFLQCCNSGETSKKPPLIFCTEACSTIGKTENIHKLIDSNSVFNHRFVEISGYYYKGIEETILAIYPEGPRNNQTTVIWIDFDPNLFKGNYDDIRKIIGKQIKVRGTADGPYAGHLARIRDVCYVEVLQ